MIEKGIRDETCQAIFPGADPDILKSGGPLSQQPWLVKEENFRFQMV